MDDNEMTLFGSDSSSDISDGRQGQLFGTQEKLSVLRFHVDGVEKWLPDDLFAGYTSIKMVTFSFSKSLIQHLVKQLFLAMSVLQLKPKNGFYLKWQSVSK